MFCLLFVIFAGAAIAANVYDILMSEKGLKAGVGVEKDDEFVGDRPTMRALFIRDFIFLSPFLILPLVAYGLGNVPLAYGSLTGPAVAAYKHVSGGLAWRKLLKG